MTVFAALYTDEDMSALVATLLRSRGLDITTVPEQATLGKTDREQLEFATAQSRCLLTHNRVDFERLHLQ
jgi:predicted nuclease of predicted toxin-antitoxin system